MTKTRSRFFSIGIGAALLLLLSFSSAAPALAQSQTIPVERLLNPDGTLNTTTGVNGALDLRGWNVTLDSKRGPILSMQSEPAAPAAASPTDEWWALPHKGLSLTSMGNDGTVNALAVVGNNMFVGGDFNYTFDGGLTDTGGIIKFDNVNRVWSDIGGYNNLNYEALNDGYCTQTPGSVNALATIGTALYIGGAFQDTGGCISAAYNNIAKFETSTNTWSQLAHNGLNGEVDALAASGNDLFVGGNFKETFDGVVLHLGHIAKYSSGAWSVLDHDGLNGVVYALAVSGADLFAGGHFVASEDGFVLDLNHIAKLSSGAWNSLPDDGLNDDVFALAVESDVLYVGGIFTRTYGSAVTNLNRIAEFDTGTSTWSALPHHGLNGTVLAIAVDSSTNTVYVGGGFAQTADGQVTNLNKIAKLHLVLHQGLVWSALPNHGLNGAVNALTSIGDDLYVGGAFTQSADGNVTNLNRIAKLAPMWQQFLPLIKK